MQLLKFKSSPLLSASEEIDVIVAPCGASKHHPVRMESSS